MRSVMHSVPHEGAEYAVLLSRAAPLICRVRLPRQIADLIDLSKTVTEAAVRALPLARSRLPARPLPMLTPVVAAQCTDIVRWLGVRLVEHATLLEPPVEPRHRCVRITRDPERGFGMNISNGNVVTFTADGFGAQDAGVVEGDRITVWHSPPRACCARLRPPARPRR